MILKILIILLNILVIYTVLKNKKIYKSKELSNIYKKVLLVSSTLILLKILL